MTDSSRLSVLLTTEGTYPYHKGGVSTWCHALTSKVSDVDFTILAVAMHPYMASAYQLAPNVRGLVTVPLWGTEDPAEYGWYRSATEFLKTRWQTTGDTVASRFLPPYMTFLREALADPPSLALAADAVTALHTYFTTYDYQRTMSDPLAWSAFVEIARCGWADAEPDEPPPSLGECADAWRLLARLMTVLATPIPRTDLTHSAAAAFCGLPCLVARMRWGTPFLLTEHGVYLREQYLNLARSIRSLFIRWLMSRVIGMVADLNYAYADLIAPVCRYNTRWERWRGVPERRIQVIYNGVDPARFAPAVQPRAGGRPTVVSVGLIFPLKGQLDLIAAAARIRERIPDVEVLLYGSASDRDYFTECQALVQELGLQETVRFAGTTAKPWEVYQTANVVAMSSVSEAFPYAVIEAMLTGAAVVATDVGGVNEAVGPAGVLVQPRNPAALADAIVSLLQSPDERRRLGAAARARALEYFTEDRFVEEYRSAYRRFAGQSAGWTARSVVRPFPARRRSPAVDWSDGTATGRPAGCAERPARTGRVATDTPFASRPATGSS